MAAASVAARGKAALESSNFELAIKEYTAAIKESPTSPDYYNQRSTANLRAGHFKEALSDAENAVLNAQKRAKRELIIDSQFRRALALYKLERYADADFLLKQVKKMKSDHKQCDMWISKAAMAMKDLSESDERRQVSVTETPSISSDGSAKEASSTSNATSSSTKPSDSAPPTTASQTPADKIRWEWYQSTENIYFTLLAKGAPKDKTQVEITSRSLSISFPLTSGSSYDLTLEPLFAPINPEKCTTRIMPSKIEIILSKTTPGQKWSAFESSETLPADSNTSTTIPSALLEPAQPTAPAYPTSSKSGPKDWDKISKDLRRSERSEQAGDAGEAKSSSHSHPHKSTPGPSGYDSDDSDDGGDESNKFFKFLYKQSDPDTRRAMMKSYQESNGTALSTNWEEVSKKTYETLPPDGMEAKKWEK